jgi:heptose-I-phosphate ethanolaminephosphotransferase
MKTEILNNVNRMRKGNGFNKFLVLFSFFFFYLFLVEVSIQNFSITKLLDFFINLSDLNLTQILIFLFLISIFLIPSYFQIYKMIKKKRIISVIGYCIILFGNFLIFLIPVLLFNISNYFLIFSIIYLPFLIFEIGHIYKYNETSTLGSYYGLFQTNLLELKEYLNSFKMYFKLLLLFFLIMFFYLISFLETKIIFDDTIKITFLILIFLYFSIFLLIIKLNHLYLYYPIYMPYFFIKEKISSKKSNIQRKQHKFDVERKTNKNEEETYIFVIGESMRKNRLSLYNFKRNTTPKLNKRKKSLIIFNKTYTIIDMTAKAITFLLSFSNIKKQKENDKKLSIISILKECDFKTYWLSNQDVIGQWSETEVKKIIDECSEIFSTKSNLKSKNMDEELLVPLKNILENKKNKKKAIFINLYGSHLEYNKRYPEKFNKFNKNEKIQNITKLNLSKENEKILNEYDNSILYTDFILDKFLELLNKKKSKSFLFYISDHGENLFDNDNNNYGHSTFPLSKYTFQVPMFFWFSKHFKKEKILIEKNKNKINSNDNLINTFLDLTKIKVKEFEKNKSLLSSNFKEIKKQKIINPNLEIQDFKIYK